MTKTQRHGIRLSLLQADFTRSHFTETDIHGGYCESWKHPDGSRAILNWEERSKETPVSDATCTCDLCGRKAVSMLTVKNNFGYGPELLDFCGNLCLELFTLDEANKLP